MLLENALEDLATALQRSTDSLFASLANEGDHKRDENMFQRLAEASELWKHATGTGYEDILDSSEWSDILCMMQRRHKLGHKQGHVDQKYIHKSGDTAYAAGQRLVIREEELRRSVVTTTKLVEGLRRLVS